MVELEGWRARPLRLYPTLKPTQTPTSSDLATQTKNARKNTQTQTHTQRVLRRRVWTLIVERLLAVSTPGQAGEHVGPWGGRLRWAASQGLDSAPHIVNRLFTLVEGVNQRHTTTD